MNEHRYLEPTSAMRIKLIAVCLVVICVGLAFDRWVAPLLRWVASLPTCESLPWVRLELISAVLMCWLIAYMALRQGAATWQSGQTPLPNTWVWSRTRVRTGKFAKATALSAFAMSATFFLGPIVLIVWQRLYLVFCWPQSCGCE